MANNMFEVTVSNSVRNQTQNVPGYYGTGTGSGFTSAVCAAGQLCVQNGLVPMEGYEEFDILNGNTWYFNVATSGKVTGFTGDHTGIFAFNNYDVNKVTDAAGNSWNIGFNTLGISLPAGERGDFCELLVGEQYTFGLDNLTAAPTTGQIYATVSAAGKWTPTNTAPTDGSVYAEILRTKPVNEGAYYWGTGYVLRIVRSEAATE